jgi:hypothetical protein
MFSMIRNLAKLAFIVVAITICLPAASSRAQDFTFFYVSATGSGNACTVAQPCAAPGAAFLPAFNAAKSKIACLSPINMTDPNVSFGVGANNVIFEMDCPEGTSLPAFFWLASASNTMATFRNVTFTNLGLSRYAIQFLGSGTLILENCVLATADGPSLDLEPNGPLKVVVKNSRISGNVSGLILKPVAGGSINATLDHVTINQNTGGGIKVDTTDGPVTLDLTDSEISGNGGNGVNAVASGANQAIVSIEHSVIARNGSVGVQANGASAGLLLSRTLLDQNAVGALSVVNGGNIFTYGDNRVVGSQGSSFTSTAALK